MCYKIFLLKIEKKNFTNKFLKQKKIFIENSTKLKKIQNFLVIFTGKLFYFN